jgi:hypothetical protein
MEKLDKLIENHFLENSSRSSLSSLVKKIKLDNELFLFLDNYLNFGSLRQKLYHYQKKTNINPVCLVCKKTEVNWVENRNLYRTTCSTKCSGKLNKVNKGVKKKKPVIKCENEFLNYIVDNRIKLTESNIIGIYPEIINSINNYITFETDIFSEKVYCYLYKIDTKPTCNYCNMNNVKFDTFSKGYHKYCSVKCSSNSIEKKTNIENTCLVKYGVKNIGEITRNKANLTMIERYGMNYSKTDEFKIKYKSNSIEKYGVEHPFMSIEVKKIIKNTLIKRYGVDNPQKSIYIVNKMLNTKKEKGLIYKWTETELMDIKSYRRSISYYTELEYNKYKSIINPDDIERGLYTNHIDHIYPVIEGWKNKISPKLLSSYKNLRLIPSNDNLSKGDRTDLDLDDFLYSVFNI